MNQCTSRGLGCARARTGRSCAARLTKATCLSLEGSFEDFFQHESAVVRDPVACLIAATSPTGRWAFFADEHHRLRFVAVECYVHMSGKDLPIWRTDCDLLHVARLEADGSHKSYQGFGINPLPVAASFAGFDLPHRDGCRRKAYIQNCSLSIDQ